MWFINSLYMREPYCFCTWLRQIWLWIPTQTMSEMCSTIATYSDCSFVLFWVHQLNPFVVGSGCERLCVGGGAVWKRWLFFPHSFHSPLLSLTSVEVGLSFLFFFCLFVSACFSETNGRELGRRWTCIYATAACPWPAVPPWAEDERPVYSVRAMMSFWWFTAWKENLQSVFSVALLLSFSILNRFYFINAFWWRVITASYFEFVCSGLLWYNLFMWLLDWIKRIINTHLGLWNWWLFAVTCKAEAGPVCFRCHLRRCSTANALLPGDIYAHLTHKHVRESVGSDWQHSFNSSVCC